MDISMLCMRKQSKCPSGETMVGIQCQNRTQVKVRTASNLWKKIKAELDWMGNMILPLSYDSWVFPKEEEMTNDTARKKNLW